MNHARLETILAKLKDRNINQMIISDPYAILSPDASLIPASAFWPFI